MANTKEEEELEFIEDGDASEEDLDFIEDPQNPSTLDSILDVAKWPVENVLVPIGRTVDRVTGAPTRAAIGAAQQGLNPVSAGWHQFLKDPDLAPSGKELVQRAGVPNTALSDVLPSLYSETGEGLPLKKGGWLDPTASGVAGLGMDVIADPTNVIPVIPAAKVAGRLGGAIGGGAAKIGAGVADAVSGTKAASSVVDTAGNLAKNTLKAAESVVSPKQADTWAKSLAVAEKNGINPEFLSEAIEFGPKSFISRLSRNIGEGPAGEARLAKHEKGVQAINESVSNRINSIAGAPVPSDAAEAGKLVKSTYDDASDKFFKSIDLTHDTVQEYAPGLYIDKAAKEAFDAKVNGVEKYAKGLISRGTDAERSQGKHLLRTVESLRKGNGTYKQLNEQRQWIGKYAFADATPIGAIPPDIKKAQEVYFAINEALVDTIKKHVNPDFAEEIVQNNRKMSDFFKTRSEIIDDIKGGSADEKVFSKVLSDSKKAAAFKEIVGQERFNQIGGAYLKSILKYSPDSTLNFGSSLQALKAKMPVLKSIFKADEIKNLEDLLKLGYDQGPSLLSSSGTGASNQFSNLIKGLANNAISDKTIDVLKQKARGTFVPEIPNVPAAKPSLSSRLNTFTKEVSSSPRTIGYRPGASNRLKALQVGSVSLREDERNKNRKRLKALED